MRKRTVVSLLMVSALAMFPANGQEPIEGEESELVLRETPWTHLVVTLKGGKRVTYTREDVVKVQYLTQRGGGGRGSVGSGWMGRVWRIRETAPDGRYCDGVWTRQGTTNRFNGNWTCSWGAMVSDALVVQPLTGRNVVVYREGVRENYRGTLAADGKTITGAAWGVGGKWTAKIE